MRKCLFRPSITATRDLGHGSDLFHCGTYLVRAPGFPSL
jgi:hypothetical protein